MRILYITEPGSFITQKDNKLIVKKDKDAVILSIGLEQIEAIIIIGNAHLTTGLTTSLLEREISVTWLSSTGKFFGRLEPTTGHNIERIIQQFDAFKNKEFRLEISKKWISAKVKNSIVVLRRYNRTRDSLDVSNNLEQIEKLLPLINRTNEIDEIMGYEGTISRIYYESLSLLLPEEFKFKGRSKRPPKDPFNSLISFGYTLLLYELFAILSSKSLQPYLGLMHQPRRGHPALASDLMEEWRSVIVDSLAMKLITTNQIKISDFHEPDIENGGVYLNRDSSKAFIQQFEQRSRTENKYSSLVDYPVTYRESLTLQVGSLIKAIEKNDTSIYRPIQLR